MFSSFISTKVMFFLQVSTEKQHFVCCLTKFNRSILIGETRLKQVVLFSVRQTSISAGSMVVAMHTIPPIAKKDGVY
jgi:hypothetical protein